MSKPSNLHLAARRVWKAYLKYGPVDDGRPEGDEFEQALDGLMIAEKREDRQNIQRLIDTLDQALDTIAGIRYRDWPTIGLGIGLNAERLDEILLEGERAINAAKRAGLAFVKKNKQKKERSDP